MSEQIEVVRDDEKQQYEITVDGRVAGVTTYEPDEQGRLVFPHTEIDPAYGGRGLGSKLVGEALADAAQRGETVVPECPFVVKYLRENEVPGLEVAWREGGAADGVDAPATEKLPGDEGVGSAV